MQAQLQKKKNFFILYIILAAANFFYKIFNLIRHSVLTGFTVTEFFAYFGRAVLYMLPLVAFIFISKKTAEIENMEKHLKIKKYVTAYLIVSPVYGVWKYFLNRLCNWNLPIFPSCLFYPSSWLSNLEMLIKYHFSSSIINLLFEICFMVISIMFIKNINKEIPPEEEFKEGIGKTSAGFKVGIAGIAVLSIQTVLNILVAIVMHENMSYVSGEHVIGTAVLAFILIAVKVFIDLIFLPAIPLSIIGLVKCNSKKEIEQDRKNRLLGKKINIACLVIASLELILFW